MTTSWRKFKKKRSYCISWKSSLLSSFMMTHLVCVVALHTEDHEHRQYQKWWLLLLSMNVTCSMKTCN